MDGIVSQKNSLKPHPGQLPLPKNISQRELDAENFLIQLEQRMADGDNFGDLPNEVVSDDVRELAARIAADLAKMYKIMEGKG